MTFELLIEIGAVFVALFLGYIIGKEERVKQNAGLYVIKEYTDGTPKGFSIEMEVPIKEIEKNRYAKFRVVKKLL